MAFNTEHQPKQAAALLAGSGRVSIYNTTGGAVTQQFAQHNLTLIPPIPSGSIIHDNCCGAGTVSRLLLSSPQAPADLELHATDTDQIFLDALQQDVTSNGWPVHVSNQRAEKLSFPENSFTHSITNIGIFFTTGAGLDGAREVYRTPKPGGIAVVNCWEALAWLTPFKQTHQILRPDIPYPTPRILWNDGTQLQRVMSGAGFLPENTRVSRSVAWARTRNVRDWAEKSWAFLGGLGGWRRGSDEARWDEAVGLMVKFMLEQPGTEVRGEEVWMKGSQWIVVATK
ncbi:hypothetical protein ACN47E_001887 [Coniothyrium glycines]